MENLEEIKFDGGANPELSKLKLFVERCRDRAINLESLNLGIYEGCNGCEYQKTCQTSSYMRLRFG